MERLQDINKRLVEYYGRGYKGLPKYRVVWAGTELEKRYGTFIKETDAGIYLGQQTCEREVLKYPFWPNFWILESVQINIGNPELLADHSYEPLFRFADVNDNPLPYDWEVIQKVIGAHNQRVVPRNDAMILSAEQDRMRKEEAEDLIMIQDSGSAFGGKLASGEAVGYGVKK